MRRVLLDTGPLVALLDRRDRHHAWAIEQWSRLDPPLFSCEAVLVEACHLLRRLSGGPAAVLAMLLRGGIVMRFRVEEEAGAIAKLLARYHAVPMSLADACLVRMAEQHADVPVFTLDHDFRLYRRHGRKVVPTLMPDDRT